LVCSAAVCAASAGAQTLSSNSTGTHDGYYYSFWKDNGNATMTLQRGGRYQSRWDSSTNNWVGGKGWNPGASDKVVSYSGHYDVDNSQNSYLALYGWTKNPLVEYYVIESYGSYNPSSCNGGTNYGTLTSDGATYNIRRCQRVNQPSIDGTATFYQYFSVRSPKKEFGNISGTITVANHFNAWASKGLNLGNHNYMVLATEGYRSNGSSDITVSDGPITDTGSITDNTTINSPSKTNIVVRAQGTAGGEHINLRINDSIVADWNLTTSATNYVYTGNAGGNVQVEFDNDGGDRDAIIDWVFINGETRQAEDMDINTATYGNGECGGGSNSETMHCNGLIGFGGTGNCFSNSCNNDAPSGTTSNNTGVALIDTGTSSHAGTNTLIVRAKGSNGEESITLSVGGVAIKTWTMSTTNRDYTAQTDVSGDIEVAFTNDATGRDVQLDYVSVNGDIRQTEDMPDNTSTYSGSCGGGSYSEMMHCNGVIGFGPIDNSIASSYSSLSSAPSSMSSSSRAPSSMSSSSRTFSSEPPVGNCIEMCQWYQDAPRPLCTSTASGWGYENNQSCISRSTCQSQYGDGGVIDVCDEPVVSSSSQSSTNSSINSISSSESSSSSSAVIMGDSDMLARIDIYTDGKTIVDDPKTDTRMEVTEYDGSTPVITYDGYAGIEFRGSSSQLFFPKKSYGLETRDIDGKDLDVPLLGFPKEEDWILYAPYSDKTMMRNTLMYSLSAQIDRYASRWRYIDLYINSEYQGVYVFMEKIKRDKNRVDIAKLKVDEISGEDVTGGYILKLDKTTGESTTTSQNPWGGFGGGNNFSNFTDANSFETQQAHMQSGGAYHILYDYPEPEDIAAEQKAYIQQAFHAFEAALASSNFSDENQGYRAHIDVESFIDYFLFTELSADVDAFTMSTYIVKDKNDKFAMGPLWDYNLAFGNANFCDGTQTNVWKYKGCAEMAGYPMPFWWGRLLEDNRYKQQLQNRWQTLRATVFSEQNIYATMDDIKATLDAADAINRNQQRWPVIGQEVWPNVFVGATYSEELSYMKNWIHDRLSWMDSAISNL